MTKDIATSTERTAAGAPEGTRTSRVWRPLTDIVETRDGIRLMVEMPGVGPDDVEVTLERGVLSIRGRSQSNQPETLQLTHAEYEPGDYERAFSLSDAFDPDRIEAQMHGGVLTLDVPRLAEAQPRTIKVRAA